MITVQKYEMSDSDSESEPMLALENNIEIENICNSFGSIDLDLDDMIVKGCILFKKDTCTTAASRGYLKCLKYAHVNGCPWDENTCAAAAENGQFNCLKYAHLNGCPWDSRTCEIASKNNHIDCLTYAYENGCQWDDLESSKQIDM
jgi:hypothetical protein